MDGIGRIIRGSHNTMNEHIGAREKRVQNLSSVCLLRMQYQANIPGADPCERLLSRVHPAVFSQNLS